MVWLENSPVLEVAGADVVDLFQRVSTNEMSPLRSKEDVCTIFTTEKGRIAECAHVVPLEDQSGFVMFLAGCLRGDFSEWLAKYIIMEDVRLSPDPLSSGQWFVYSDSFASPPFTTDHRATLQQSGFLAVNEEWRGLAWGRLVDLGNDGRAPKLIRELLRVETVDIEAFHAARITGGIPFAGFELTEAYNPLEARLRERISFTKGCYIGQEVIARLDTYKKVSKILVTMEGTGSARTGIIQAGGKDTGVVTSATEGRKNTWVGLGYVRTDDFSKSLLMKSSGSRVSITDTKVLAEVYGEPHV